MPTMAAMDITVHQALLPHDDPEASPALYRTAGSFARIQEVC